ncbi:MAG: cysteine--tRNA ligase [Alphaproteobacteria bacterium GM202ARS2]|nr:cysteine--tRNA ligase [Alphaproteobacteria bacterium GM202ARS2]
MLTLYNTQSKRKSAFHPLDARNVRVYVCGPTVYDDIHIGNARPMVVFDVLVRVLRRLYPRVTYARNITDIDDKIIARANKNNESTAELSQRMVVRFHEQMDALGVLPPDKEPLATHHIDAMIALIATLLEKKHAYVAEGHVLFHVPSMPSYGALSQRKREAMLAGARVDVAPYKKDPFDFVLWKPSHKDMPAWPSPWGKGRPGWHIECSAMSNACLGTPFDIHGGGIDLLFPHHENEVAQSCCAFNCTNMAQVWLHNGYIVMNDEKMSKSLGNDVRLCHLLATYPPQTLRYFLLSAHYRQPTPWQEKALKDATRALDTLYEAQARLAAVAPLKDTPDSDTPDSDASISDIQHALADDLNTPLALAHLHRHAKTITKNVTGAPLRAAVRAFRDAQDLLGLVTLSAEDWFQSNTSTTTESIDETFIRSMITQREEARRAKDFQKADELRDTLYQQGIILEDTPQGVQWKRRR